MQQEAVIGIVYAVSASLGVLALDRAPQGAEHIRQLLIGSILTVTPQEVGQLALLYAAIGAAHWASAARSPRSRSIPGSPPPAAAASFFGMRCSTPPSRWW